jgi:hypothetical protein
MIRILESFRDWMDQIEALATDALAALGPWLAPIPSAALVARASVEHLRWPNGLGLVAGAIIEVLGLTATSTALMLWGYNESKRKMDPSAPFALTVVLVGFYYASTVGLTVLLDIVPDLARFAPVIFPTLALVGTVNLALRAQHKRRVATIATQKAERRAKRQAKRQTAQVSNVSNIKKFDTKLDALQAGRKAKRNARLDALLAFYVSNPEGNPTEAAQAIGVSRQTIYTYNAELEQAGRLQKNGNGWEVTQ